MTRAWAQPGTARAGTARAGTGLAPVRHRRVSLAWPRLPAVVEVAIVAAGYFGYALVRLAVRASRPAAVAHAAGLWRAERWLHVDIEQLRRADVDVDHEPQVLGPSMTRMGRPR